ncbi:hypothetical protein QYE76_067628 [Lolium multiflorum]|uniref:Uncharacterized protein n=1 Tax=Lolium multiflorum TaxID=4521 RepID=A0AAD8SDU8_LOLMU|nr:hypothetical protein QYE76_067628 [Lolium multiflorum]
MGCRLKQLRLPLCRSAVAGSGPAAALVAVLVVIAGSCGKEKQGEDKSGWSRPVEERSKSELGWKRNGGVAHLS